MSGLVAFAMNPALACSSGEDLPDWQYGQAEMAQAVEGTWRVDYRGGANGPASATFRVVPRPPQTTLQSVPGRSLQCGNREFFSTAAACIDMSTLYLSGEVLNTDVVLLDQQVTGSYRVMGTVYRGGELQLTVGKTLSLQATLDASNRLSVVSATENGAFVFPQLERVP
jgi:hypothetical protein